MALSLDLKSRYFPFDRNSCRIGCYYNQNRWPDEGPATTTVSFHISPKEKGDTSHVQKDDSV